MLTAGDSQDVTSDVIVVGAGAVGLTAAIALARTGRTVALVGPAGGTRPGRTVALLQSSVDLLRRLHIWPLIESQAEPLRAMRIVDATGSLFAPPPVLFRAEEIGLAAFGYNIDNNALEDALGVTAEATPGLRRITSAAKSAIFANDSAEVRTYSGDLVRAVLLVAADGRESLMRKLAHIGVRSTAHRQRAMTAVFTHHASHENISTEFHTREGPFTLVPMPGTGSRRSSLVWVMTPAEAERRRTLPSDCFAREAERQCRGLLGRMTLDSAVGNFPIITRIATRLVGPRLVLLGEAAHALPPIGAQGLNLSFRDIAALAAHLGPRPAGQADIGAPSVLAVYERDRRGDVASRIAGVGLLNESLLSHTAGIDLLRGVGLAALGRIAPLRRFAMRQGLAPGAGSSLRPVA